MYIYIYNYIQYITYCQLYIYIFVFWGLKYIYNLIAEFLIFQAQEIASQITLRELF